jgi:hypothetical protein
MMRPGPDLPEGVIARLDLLESGYRLVLPAALPATVFAEMLRTVADAVEVEAIPPHSN